MAESIRPYRKVNGLKVMDLENYVVYHLSVISSRLSRGASALFRERYGVGVVEWRCMVMLAMEEGVTGARISQVAGINKSLVSRSLAKLEDLGLVEDYAGATTRKPRRLQFTAAGLALYREMVEVVISREQTLRTGLTSVEIRELLRMLRILFNNADSLDEVVYHIDLDPRQ